MWVLVAPLALLAGCAFQIPGLDPVADGGARDLSGDLAGADLSAAAQDLSIPADLTGPAADLACAAPFADCDKNPANGCEVNVSIDIANCGGCGNACALANATPSCVAGLCGIVSCNGGFADCDKDPKNGCEVALGADAMNCGACGRICPLGGSGAKCNVGVCSTLPPMDNALVGYWSLDDAGPMIKDASANNNHGVNSGAVKVAGKVGGGYLFAVRTCIGVPDSPSLQMVGSGTMTMMAWNNYAGGCDLATHGIVVNKEQTYELGPLCNAPPAIQGAIQPSGGNWAWFGTKVQTLNAWQHVAFTWDGVAQHVYVDGVETDAGNLAGVFAARATGLGIGCRGVAANGDVSLGYGYFIGVLDEVAIYKRALTAPEILTYYNNTK